jgi:hypothetical protein
MGQSLLLDRFSSDEKAKAVDSNYYGFYTWSMTWLAGAAS